MTTASMSPAPDLSQLSAAAEWRLIGLLLECPSSGWTAEVVRLASEVGDPDLTAAAAAAAVEASPGLYHSTFGPGGPAAPRGVSHQTDVLPGAAIAELRDLYQAFAYVPTLAEPPDHIAIECGFAAYLCLKQAYALAREDHQQSRICAKAQEHFMAEHLAPLARFLAVSLASSEIPYLVHLARALQARVGLPPRDVRLPITPELEGCEEA